METKICRTCGIEKSTSEFYYRSEIKRYRLDCKRCLLDKQKEKRKVNKKPKKEKIIPEFKICKNCKIEKPFIEFRKGNLICKVCENERNMERYYNKKLSDPEYVEKRNIEKENNILKEQNLKRCSICKQIKPFDEFYYRKDLNNYRNWCKDCEKSRTKDFYIDNKEVILEKQHQSYKDNRDVILQRKKEYAKTHKEQLREYHTKYVFDRRRNDDIFHFKSQIRHLINQSFRRWGIQKRGKTEDIVGCDFSTFNEYLLKTYKDNYGVEWDGKEEVHVDHIIPLSTANTEEDILKLCNFKNLQLLKAKDNLDKKDKLNWEVRNDKDEL